MSRWKQSVGVFDWGTRGEFIVSLFVDWRTWLSIAIGAGPGGLMGYLAGLEPVWIFFGTIGAGGAAALVYIAIVLFSRNQTNPSLGYATDIPDLRVADAPSIVALLESKERDKLFPLLEAERLRAWARPMTGGEPPLTKLPGATWVSHHLIFHAKSGAGTINQTYFRNRRNELKYYDLHLNRAEIEQVWPGVFSERNALPEKSTPSTLASAPYYSRDDVDQMLAAMRRISTLLNQTAVDARDFVQEIMDSMGSYPR